MTPRYKSSRNQLLVQLVSSLEFIILEEWCAQEGNVPQGGSLQSCSLVR